MDHPPASAETLAVVAAVADERASHAARGYDNDHDDNHHSVHRLVELSDRYAHRGDTGYYERDNLIKATSLLVAAIELLDRSEKRDT